MARNRYLRLLYRLIKPVFDPRYFLAGLYGYFWYFRDLLKFSRMTKNAGLFGTNMYPMLHDKTSLTPFDPHYFYQQVWLFGEIYRNKPSLHVDVGSIHTIVGIISEMVPTEFVDIRPMYIELSNLKIVQGSILDLPYPSSSVESLSCLHVAEHIGLGRYGDPIDPMGFVKSCKELTRVLKPGGKLYFSTPIGVQHVSFNAHRVSNPNYVVECFEGLSLDGFDAVDDEGKYVRDADIGKSEDLSYGLGMFVFEKH
jgi:hypothetical protein